MCQCSSTGPFCGTDGVIVIQRTPESTGPSADSDFSPSPEEPSSSPTQPANAPAVKDCGHRQGVWCVCKRHYKPAPDDDPEVMHEQAILTEY